MMAGDSHALCGVISRAALVKTRFRAGSGADGRGDQLHVKVRGNFVHQSESKRDVHWRKQHMKSAFTPRQTLSRAGALSAVATGAALLFSASAMAQQANSPFYVGGALGASMTDGNYASQVQNASGLTPGYTFHSASRRNDNEFAGRLYAGWRFTPNLAVEAGYTNFGTHDVRYRLNKSTDLVPANSPYVVNGHNKLDGFTLDLVGTLPVSQAFSVNGRVGMMATNLKYNEDIANPVVIGGTYSVSQETYSAPRLRKTAFHWGVGGAYQLNRNVALTADYQRVQGVGNSFAWTDNNNGKLNYGVLMGGVRYSF